MGCISDETFEDFLFNDISRAEYLTDETIHLCRRARGLSHFQSLSRLTSRKLSLLSNGVRSTQSSKASLSSKSVSANHYGAKPSVRNPEHSGPLSRDGSASSSCDVVGLTGSVTS